MFSDQKIGPCAFLKKLTLEKCSITSYMLKGVSPPPLWLP